MSVLVVQSLQVIKCDAAVCRLRGCAVLSLFSPQTISSTLEDNYFYLRRNSLVVDGIRKGLVCSVFKICNNKKNSTLYWHFPSKRNCSCITEIHTYKNIYKICNRYTLIFRIQLPQSFYCNLWRDAIWKISMTNIILFMFSRSLHSWYYLSEA